MIGDGDRRKMRVDRMKSRAAVSSEIEVGGGGRDGRPYSIFWVSYLRSALAVLSGKSTPSQPWRRPSLVARSLL